MKSLQEKTKEELLKEIQNLKESESRYKRLVENIRYDYIFYSYDTNGVFIYISPSVTTILGYTPQEFCKHFTTYLTDHPINDTVKKYSLLSIQGINQLPYEVDVYHKNGTTRRLKVIENPVYGKDGHVTAVEGIAHDITEREEANKKLKQLNQLLMDERNIFVKGDVVVFKWQNKAGWPVEYVSPNVGTIFGYSVNEFIAGHVSYAEIIFPSDAKRVGNEVK